MQIPTQLVDELLYEIEQAAPELVEKINTRNPELLYAWLEFADFWRIMLSTITLIFHAAGKRIDTHYMQDNYTSMLWLWNKLQIYGLWTPIRFALLTILQYFTSA